MQGEVSVMGGVFRHNPAVAVTWIRWPLAVSISVHYRRWFAINERREM